VKFNIPRSGSSRSAEGLDREHGKWVEPVRAKRARARFIAYTIINPESVGVPLLRLRARSSGWTLAGALSALQNIMLKGLTSFSLT